MQRFYLLDLTRTIAALSVVLLHYRQFFWVSFNTFGEGYNIFNQPFYSLLEWFYTFGHHAVPYFFTLSGFVFFHTYNQTINQKKILFKNYLILRFSRLYPLHFATLVLVLFLQFFYYYLNKKYFVHDANTFKNFILHLFLVQEWSLKPQFAFNAPSWSISVEIILYVFFFFVTFLWVMNLKKVFIIFIILLIFQIFNQPKFESILIGLLCFYSGGVIYFIFENVKKLQINNYILLLIILLLDIIIFGRYLNPYFLNYQKEFSYLFGERIFILLFFFKFPLLILNLALIQVFFIYLGKSLKLLGDISYTIYLIHFPIMLIFSIIHTFIKINFYSNFFFLFYFFSLFITSILVFKFYESPLKIKIRDKFIKNLC
jgi:peptidoglycan/LPS O-acetylase OafA/YrhL